MKIRLPRIVNITSRFVFGGGGVPLSCFKAHPNLRAARSSGSKLDEIEDLDGSSPEDNGVFGKRVNQVKRWFMSHSQYLNVWTILLLASVSWPAPLYLF